MPADHPFIFAPGSFVRFRMQVQVFVNQLSESFLRAQLWGMLKEENPVHGIKMFHEEKRERFLTAEEIARLNQALMSEPDWRWRAFFPLSLLLGTRRSELITARWADIAFAQAVWRIPNTKSGRPHLLHFLGPPSKFSKGCPVAITPSGFSPERRRTLRLPRHQMPGSEFESGPG